MNKLRIGLVGCGPIAQNAHLPAIEKARDIRLQAIADTDAALRESVSLRYCPRSVYKHSDEIFPDPNGIWWYLPWVTGFTYLWQ